MKLWLKLLITGAIIFIVTMVVIYIFVYNKPHTDYEKSKPKYVLTAEDLYHAFIENRTETESKFNGNIVLITGSLTSIEQSEDLIILNFSFSDGLFGDEGVRCTMLENHHEKSKQLAPGTEVSVKGLCTGFTGSDVILEFCSLQ